MPMPGGALGGVEIHCLAAEPRCKGVAQGMDGDSALGAWLAHKYEVWALTPLGRIKRQISPLAAGKFRQLIRRNNHISTLAFISPSSSSTYLSC